MTEYILITGSRTWKDYDLMEKVLVDFRETNQNAILVHGNANGADKMADFIWTKKIGGETRKCPITNEEWKQYGKVAGPMRNAQMLKDYVISRAFAFCMDESSGTMHMISLLHSAKIPVDVYMEYSDTQGVSQHD